jgi:hypothetical protein
MEAAVKAGIRDGLDYERGFEKCLRNDTLHGGNWIVVAEYVMVDENLPHDRRDYHLLVSIVRQ